MPEVDPTTGADPVADPTLGVDPNAADGTPAKATDPAGDSAHGGSPSKDPAPEPWFQKRINALTAQKRETERENAALRAQLAQSKTPPASPDIESLVTQRARELARQQTLNEAANRTYADGKLKYQDFDHAVHSIQAAGEVTPEFLDSVTRLPNAADVYYFLGKNPDQAANILSLDGVPMALELAHLSAKLGKPKGISQAPAPTTTVGGTAGAPAGLTDDLPIAEWIRRREAQRQ